MDCSQTRSTVCRELFIKECVMTVKKAINDYLDAVERVYGTHVRKQTLVKHGKGSTLLIKQGDHSEQCVTLDMLPALTHSLRSFA